MPSVGKGLGMVTRLLKWLLVENMNSCKKGIDAVLSCWHKAFDVYGDYVEKYGV
jgi:hypothetical protein